MEPPISQASDHHASPDAAASAAPDETASSEELTTENLSELILPAGTFNNIFTCADVTEAISNYLLENHSELAGSLESALDELREQDVGVDVEAQNNILLHGDIIEAMSNFPLENHSEITTALDNSDYQIATALHDADELPDISYILAAILPVAVDCLHNVAQSAQSIIENKLRTSQSALIDAPKPQLKSWANSTVGSDLDLDRDFNDCILANLDFRHITTDDDTDNDTDTDEDHPAGYTTMTKIQEAAELIRSGMVNAVLRFIRTSPAKSTLLVKELERNSAVLLRNFCRGNHRFTHSNGTQATIYPTNDDGSASLFCIYMFHAQRRPSHKLELCYQLENAAVHFTSGSILKAVDLSMPFLDALQIHIATYDVTIHRLGHALITCSTVFQHLYDLYCNNPPDKYVNEPLETMYTMILEVADVANETKTLDKLLASATTDDSLRYKARAHAVYDTCDATDYTDFATAHEASSHAVCSITNCQDPVPQQLLDNVKKRSPGKDLSTHTLMCRTHYQKWMAGDVLKYKSGKTKDPRQDRGRGHANATSNNKSIDKLLSAMEAETTEPSPEPTEPDLKFDQSAFDTMTSAEIKLNMLLTRLLIFEAMQNDE